MTGWKRLTDCIGIDLHVVWEVGLNNIYLNICIH